MRLPIVVLFGTFRRLLFPIHVHEYEPTDAYPAPPMAQPMRSICAGILLGCLLPDFGHLVLSCERRSLRGRGNTCGWVEGYAHVAFLVTEYTLVFRRVGGRRPDFSRPYNGWTLARPGLTPLAPEFPPETSGASGTITTITPSDGARSGEIAQVVVVPLCSTLALEPLAYEQFLLVSGVLPHALRLLARVRLTDSRAVETVRRRIQALVMAAEVQAIVAHRSA